MIEPDVGKVRPASTSADRARELTSHALSALRLMLDIQYRLTHFGYSLMVIQPAPDDPTIDPAEGSFLAGGTVGAVYQCEEFGHQWTSAWRSGVLLISLKLSLMVRAARKAATRVPCAWFMPNDDRGVVGENSQIAACCLQDSVFLWPMRVRSGFRGILGSVQTNANSASSVSVPPKQVAERCNPFKVIRLFYPPPRTVNKEMRRHGLIRADFTE